MVLLGDISAADWGKGIALSIMASLVGGASKLAIRKSWLMTHDNEMEPQVVPTIEPPSGETWTLDTTSNSTSSSTEDSSTSNPIATMSGEELTQQRKRRGRLALALRYCGMIGMSVLNPICCVLAMKYASPSILAPFSGLTMVWVILFSKLVVGEEPSQLQKIASGLIVAGEVIVACFGDHTNDVNGSTKEVLDSYKNPYFLAYFGAVGCYLIVLTYWINYSKSPMLRQYAWGSCGGTVTGMQNFLKDTLTLVKVSNGPMVWAIPFFIFMAAASAFSGLLMLTACMKRYDATYSAASFVGSFVISASIMSAAHYRTFQSLGNIWSYILYPVGLLVLMVGVYVLVRERQEVIDDEIDDEDEIIVAMRKNSEDSQVPFMYTKVQDDGEIDESREV